MAGRGPAPTKARDQRRRSTATPGFRSLPAEGRAGDPPAWPFAEQSEDEAVLWRKLWSLPQAVMWEQLRCEDIVAMYVRLFVEMAETDSSSTAIKLGNEVRQLDSKLGLSPRAMLDLRWEIGEPPEEKIVRTSPLDRVFVPDP